MKDRVFFKSIFAFFFSLLILIGFPHVSRGQEQRPYIAVMGFQAPSQDLTDVANAVSDKFTATLIASNKFRVVERNAIGTVLQEQARQLSGCTSTECAVEIGRLLAVQKIIVGNVSQVGSSYYITARLINVETGMVEKQEEITCECERDLPALLKSAEILVGKLLDFTITTTVTAKSKADLEIEKQKRLRYIAIATTVIGVSGVAIGASIEPKKSDTVASCSGTPYPSCTFHNVEVTNKSKQNIQMISLASGGAMVVVGGILLYDSSRKISKLRKQKGRITYQVTPIFDGVTVGGAVQLNF